MNNLFFSDVPPARITVINIQIFGFKILFDIP